MWGKWAGSGSDSVTGQTVRGYLPAQGNESSFISVSQHPLTRLESLVQGTLHCDPGLWVWCLRAHWVSLPLSLVFESPLGELAFESGVWEPTGWACLWVWCLRAHWVSLPLSLVFESPQGELAFESGVWEPTGWACLWVWCLRAHWVSLPLSLVFESPLGELAFETGVWEPTGWACLWVWCLRAHWVSLPLRLVFESPLGELAFESGVWEPTGWACLWVWCLRAHRVSLPLSLVFESPLGELAFAVFHHLDGPPYGWPACCCCDPWLNTGGYPACAVVIVIMLSVAHILVLVIWRQFWHSETLWAQNVYES